MSSAPTDAPREDREPPRIAQVLQQGKGKTCGKCGGRISRPGPCPVCDDSPFGRRP